MDSSLPVSPEEALRRNEQRYEGILNAQQTLIVRADTRNRITYMNAAYEQAFGLKVGETFFVKIHPDDMALTMAAIKQLQEPPYTCSLEQRCEVRGQWRCIYWQDSVIRNQEGRIIEVQGVGFDVTERKRAEEQLRDSERHFKQMAERNKALLQELDHRVRNNLSGLVGLVGAMRRTTPDVKSFADAIEARLMAMGHVHQLLGSAAGSSLDLEGIVRSLLAAMGNLAHYPTEVVICGPQVLLGPQQAMFLALSLLEWLANSCKYGAHSVMGGKVEISWESKVAAGEHRIRLRWRETGGPQIRQPVRPSLGTDLVRSFITRELRGQCLLSFPPEGADHVVEFANE